MDPFVDFLRKKLGPGLTAGFNPNEPQPLGGNDFSQFFREKVNPAALAAFDKDMPQGVADGRANAQAGLPAAGGDGEAAAPATRERYYVPPPFKGMSFEVNPNYATTTAMELTDRGKLKMSKPATSVFKPETDPETLDKQEYLRQHTLGKDQKWYDWLKPALAGAMLGAQNASRNPNAGGWDVLGAAAGGAATGGIAGKVDRESGNAISYEAFRAPKFRVEQERREAAQKLADARAHRDYGLQLDSARVQTEKGRGRNIDDQIGSRQQADNERSVYNIARIRLERAREEAQRRGVPKQTDIVDDSGKMVRINVWPDGSTEVIGKSPQPTIEGQRAASRERIATGRDATRRTAATMPRQIGRAKTSRRANSKASCLRLRRKGRFLRLRSKRWPNVGA